MYFCIMKQPGNLVIALCGPTCGGKSIVADYLTQKFYFQCIRIPADGGDASVEHFSQTFLDESKGAGIFVIDAIESLSQYEILQRVQNLKLIYVTSSPKIRLDRYKSKHAASISSEVTSYASVEENCSDNLEMLYLSSLVVNLEKGVIDTALLDSFIMTSLYGSSIVYFQQLINCVKSFHFKHGFEIASKSMANIPLIVGLMVEELGEIHECYTKGTGDIEEEHADLLYLLLGSCVTLGIDIEAAFLAKHQKNMGKAIIRPKANL